MFQCACPQHCPLHACGGGDRDAPQPLHLLQGHILTHPAKGEGGATLDALPAPEGPKND